MIKLSACNLDDGLELKMYIQQERVLDDEVQDTRKVSSSAKFIHYILLVSSCCSM